MLADQTSCSAYRRRLNQGSDPYRDNYRLVTPHPLFRFAATANTRGQGDEYGMYQGTRTMNASLIDRFSSFIEFNYMKPDRECVTRQLVPALAKDIADKMSQFAAEVRSAFEGRGVQHRVPSWSEQTC